MRLVTMLALVGVAGCGGDRTSTLARPACDVAPQRATSAPVAEPRATAPVLFVQLLGETLSANATDDATKDLSGVAQMAPSGVAVVPPFDASVAAPSVSAADASDVLFDRIRTYFAPYAITVTRTRPPSGAYTLVAVGGGHSLAGEPVGVAGIAYGIDCDATNPAHVIYDFSDDQPPAEGGLVGVAATAAHEAAHAFGLEHTDDPNDLMYSVAQPMQTLPQLYQLSFRQSGNFSPFGAGGASQPEACGRANPVNAGVLAAHLGPRSGGDVTPPSLSVSMVGPTLVVDATDDVGVVRVELYRNLELVGVAKSSPYQFSLDATSGDYLTVEAIDAAANRATQTMTYQPPPAPDDGVAVLDLSTADQALPSSPAPRSSGCAYVASSPSPSLWMLLAMLLASMRLRSSLRQCARRR